MSGAFLETLLQQPLLAVGDVHRDFEAEADVVEARGLPGHVMSPFGFG
jgi:hypothetical protein